MAKTIGVLALQGDFALHQESLEKIGVKTKTVRGPEELKDCDGIVLPGGESTTFVKLLKKTGLFEAVQNFAENRAVMGTCAGLIALANRLSNNTMETLGLIDMEVERNAYGRQVDSFVDKVKISVFLDKPEFEGVFIRAPKILSIGRSVKDLGFHGHDIVMARNDRILVTTFHPELTRDLRIHRYFIDKVVGKEGSI